MQRLTTSLAEGGLYTISRATRITKEVRRKGHAGVPSFFMQTFVPIRMLHGTVVYLVDVVKG